MFHSKWKTVMFLTNLGVWTTPVNVICSTASLIPHSATPYPAARTT